jgi:DNA-binding SARP family transcriptional activator/tetratricopeptide (TPR) repeat protein
MAAMRYRILGAIEVRVGDRPVPIPRPRSRAVLAYLLLNAGRPVSPERLVEAVWGGMAPTTARAQLQADVSAIRRALREAGTQPLATSPGGYLLEADHTEMDHVTFAVLVAEARTHDPGRAVPLLRDALALWRGPALADLTAAYAEPARANLEEQRLAAYELLADAELTLGRHSELVPELSGVARGAPWRERLRCQLMLALYRTGRRAESLATARELRQYLADEHGLDPSRAFVELERRILRADPTLDITAEDLGAVRGPVTAAAGEPDDRQPAAATDGPAGDGTPAPPAARAWTVPALLPPDIADFTGRQDQVEAMYAALTAAAEPDHPAAALTVVAVSGMGGIGKTALAVHVAHRVAEAYPDGQLYVNLRGAGATPLDPADVLARLLRHLGVDDRAIPLDPVERAESYRSRLAGRRVLVVLDDAASEEQIRTLLPGTRTCAVLVTSRVNLTGVEAARWIHLDLFTGDEAIRLLGVITDPERVAAQHSDAANIIALCGRLPLAVRVAGARLTTRPTWPLARLAAQLDDERRRLDHLATGDLAVRASLALSYRALDEPARRLFCLLGLFDLPELPSWLAAAVLGTHLNEADALVERLVDAQLLTDTGTRASGLGGYRIHDLVRLYARERAGIDEGPQRCAAALRDGFGACLALAERMAALVPGPCYAAIHGSALRIPVEGLDDPPDPLEWFDAERMTLMSAVRQACDTGLTEIAFDLAGCLEKYFDIRGMYIDWCITNEYALDACRAAGNVRGEAVMLRGLIEIRTWHSAASSGQAMERLHTDADNLAALFTMAGDERGVSDALVDLAWALAAQGQYGAALEQATRALELAQRHHHLGGQARAQLALAVGHGENLRLDAALEHLDRALSLARELGNVRYEATVLQFLGIAYTRAGDLAAAEPVLEESLVILRRYGDRYAEVLTLLTLARLHLRRGDLRARVCAAAALDIAREYTLPHHIADALGVLGELELAEGHHAEAVEYLEASVRLWRTRGWPAFLAAALASLGSARAGTDHSTAVAAWTEASQIFATLGQSGRVAELDRLIEAAGSERLRGHARASSAPE